MQPLTFCKAREVVLSTVRAAPLNLPAERLSLQSATGRVLAQDVLADRGYPPFARSIRDGFAVRSSDFPGRARVIGEVRAGESFGSVLGPGQAIEIMTGAPVPEGADAVIMVEHAARSGDEITTDRLVSPGDFIIPAGAESQSEALAVSTGTRIDYRHIAVLATVGADTVEVFAQPVVSIIPTGDELVELDEVPAPHQIRNSNAHTLAAQVRCAGGRPRVQPVARDEYDSTRKLLEESIGSALILLSGGVSAGKYDLVETVLADLGAEFYFDRVLIQPGQPLVFGKVANTFFFGLPGNPASTMVTFELFARAALDLLSGAAECPLPLLWAKLNAPFCHKTGLTRFLPARVNAGTVDPITWQGSGDVFALARANSYLVARDDRECWNTGELIEVLPR